MTDNCIGANMTPPLQHDSDVDKDGRDVSAFVQEAVEALRADPYTGRVLCDYFKTGRLQVFFVKKFAQGDTVRLAREYGYILAFATTRDGDQQDYASWSTIGYAEFVPAENDRPRENPHRVS